MKLLIKKIFKHFGYSIFKYKIENFQEGRLVNSLNHFKINKVYDIGASEGFFAKKIIYFEYTGHIISFEPIPSVHQKLLSISNNNNNWIVHDKNIALGNYSGDTIFNVSENSVSSSVLDLSNLHINNCTTSNCISKIKVQIEKFDHLFNLYHTDNDISFLKIDVQGYEWEVLQGASKSLENSIGIMCEMSFEELYKGQKLFSEIIDYLRKFGFKIWSKEHGFSNFKIGRNFQVDVVLFKF